MGWKLKEARVEKGITQQELADLSGINRVTIALIESGKTQDVMSSTILKLARALDKPIEEIFFDETVQST